MSHKRLVWGVVACAVVALGLYAYAFTAPAAHQARPTATLAGTTISLDIADTPQEREQGLSGRAHLESSEGMLFVFPEEGNYGFWMKDMLFSIDMIWISSAGRIVYIEKSASPESYPRSFDPKLPARYVLEVTAGFASAHDLQVGDRVALQ